MTDIINTELGIAVAGSADSGKSTFIGVLTTGELDNGDGSARLQIARHQHEVKSKKTSSISTKTIITQNKKAVTLIDLCGQEKYFKTTAYGISGHYPDICIFNYLDKYKIIGYSSTWYPNPNKKYKDEDTKSHEFLKNAYEYVLITGNDKYISLPNYNEFYAMHKTL